MKLTTKGRYGLRAMFDLALHYNKKPISLNSIAERQNISVSYLEQLVSLLKKAGIVKSVRGAHGGYILTRPPSEISVGEILMTLEGSFAPTECVSGESDDNCTNSEYCVSRIIYEKIKESVNSVVNSITLQDMIDDHKKINSSEIKVFCE